MVGPCRPTKMHQKGHTMKQTLYSVNLWPVPNRHRQKKWTAYWISVWWLLHVGSKPNVVNPEIFKPPKNAHHQNFNPVVVWPDAWAVPSASPSSRCKESGITLLLIYQCFFNHLTGKSAEQFHTNWNGPKWWTSKTSPTWETLQKFQRSWILFAHGGRTRRWGAPRLVASPLQQTFVMETCRTHNATLDPMGHLYPNVFWAKLANKTVALQASHCMKLYSPCLPQESAVGVFQHLVLVN